MRACAYRDVEDLAKLPAAGRSEGGLDVSLVVILVLAWKAGCDHVEHHLINISIA